MAPRPAFDRTAHIGVHPQRQSGLNWIGVVVPVGRMSVAQMRGLAAIAAELGDGDLRLTVWQNLLISGVATENIAAATQRIEALGLAIDANAIRSGLVACTGNTGCKFAASDTKRHAEEIARWCETRVPLDTPVNIHLTGCHHSCAQHFVSEIGLLACKVSVNEDDDPVEGYHILVGGGFGPNAAFGRELYRDVTAEQTPRTIERISRPISPTALPRKRHSSPSRGATRSMRSRRWPTARRANERDAAATDSVADPGVRAVHSEQRAWLNGLFAGLFGLSENVTPVSDADAAKLLAGLLDGAVSRRRGRR